MTAIFPDGTVSKLVTRPYFFADLSGTSETDEQATIGAGRIRANRINYVASKDNNPAVSA
jgi:hypothetical protein